MEAMFKIMNQLNPRRVEMKIILITFFLFVASTFSVANAGCWLEGVEYPEGTEKGKMKCGADGYWR